MPWQHVLDVAKLALLDLPVDANRLPEESGVPLLYFQTKQWRG